MLASQNARGDKMSYRLLNKKQLLCEDRRLYEEPIFSPAFLVMLLKFKNIKRVIILLGGVFGPERINKAEDCLESLREDLLKVAEENEFPPEYGGDRTFSKEVDDIVEYLRNAIRTLLEKK